MVDLYGLKNCDTCRKARKALESAGVSFVFHDVREDGVTNAQVKRWAASIGWEKLLNKSSTTWRNLSASEKSGVTEAKAIALMTATPTLMKRPIIVRDGVDVFAGWDSNTQAEFTQRR